MIKQIKAAWDWIFPWKYLRNARRECKHCGTRQDTYSTNWSDGRNSFWWETMSPVRACKRIDHGDVYPDHTKLPPESRKLYEKLEAQYQAALAADQLVQDDMDRELAGAHYKNMGYPKDQS